MAFDTNPLYDRWAPVYPPVPHNPLMLAEHRAMTTRLRRLPPPVSALDAGSGTGRYAEWLRAHGAARVTCVDRSLLMLALHRGRSGRVQADLRALPFRNGAFDVVVAGLALGEIGRLDDALTELRRVLTGGGSCVYSDFHPSWSARGWRRTFRDATGADVELPLKPHALADHQRAAGAAGLRLVHVAEVALPIGWLARWRSAPVPALVVVHCVAE